MKNHLYLLVALMLYGICYSQEQLSFEYDNAGNQIVREIICVNCREQISQEEEFVESSEHNNISYYPNPVAEVLNIKWPEDIHITTIEVYSIQGQIVGSLQNLSGLTDVALPFSNYAQGIYHVILIYDNGEQKVLKAIKK